MQTIKPHVHGGIHPGQQTTWTLTEKLAEGDAGEVYLVEALSDRRQAVLKRPLASVFNGEVHRQSDQIQTEGRILQALNALPAMVPGGRLRVPTLLDQSRPGTEGSERYFIVIERVSGFDLASLARAARMGMPEGNPASLPPEDFLFLNEIAASGSLPARVLLETLGGLFEMFDTIHNLPAREEGGEAGMILWNDVKPAHLFWEPRSGAVTVIDWGNGQISGTGETPSNRRRTPLDDQRQFLEEVDGFLRQAAPELHAALGWTAGPADTRDFAAEYAALRERLNAARLQAERELAGLRQEETALLESDPHADLSLARLEEMQRRILRCGDIPDHAGALKMAAALTAALAEEASLERARDLCEWAGRQPGAQPEAWQCMAVMADFSARLSEDMRPGIALALRAAASSAWDEVLWCLLDSLQASPEPAGWYELVQQVRSLAGIDPAAPFPPLLSLRRLALQLQSDCTRLEDSMVRSPSVESAQLLEEMTLLQDGLRAAVSNWVQLDPPPPHSGLQYGEIEPLLPALETLLPGKASEALSLLGPARKQAALTLEAWEKKEFVNAGRSLRRLLLLDPDRRRLLRAGAALQGAAGWLVRTQQGPARGQPLAEFVTGLEYEGRELRGQVGPASWLDTILEGLKAMRNSAWPGELVSAQPSLLGEMPWLQRYLRGETLARLLRPGQLPPALPAISGTRAARFGPEGEISFIEPLDAWMPEVRGSSARVYLGAYRGPGGEQLEAALKVMRADKLEYATPLFREEVAVLQAMQGVPGVAQMLECGFLRHAADEGLPPDTNLPAIQAMHGEIYRIGPDAAGQFLAQVEEKIQQGYTPYLLVEKRGREDSLFLMCDASLNRGRFQPVPALLFMSIQICDVLEEAHLRRVVYRDHKILHYYWQPELNGISVIDWNVARFRPEGITAFDIQMDLVQLGARGLHHILTGRTAPGALPLGPTRPEEIEQSARSYAAQWTYDDRRLSPGVRAVLEQLLSGAYTSAAALGSDLKQAYMDLT